MNIELMRSMLYKSEAGTITFPEVLSALAAENIEGYYKDLLRREVTYYLADARTHSEPLTLPAHMIPQSFSEDALVAAIRAAQRDEVDIPNLSSAPWMPVRQPTGSSSTAAV